MSSKKIIVVVGATGTQGGSVAKFLLKDGSFAVRAITRNPDSDAAKALVAQGAQVVKADSRDFASLSKAFEGAYGVFGVTSFWEPDVGAEGEVSQGKSMVDAAKNAGIKHFVWSTLDHTQFKPAHWESKADVDDYLKASGVPRTSLYTSFYMENFTGVMPFQKRPDGSYDFPAPLTTDAPFAIYAAADTGGWVLAAFKHPEDWLNKDMRLVSDIISAREMAKTLSNVSGKHVHVQEISPEVFDTFKNNPIPGEIHSNMLALFYLTKPQFRDPVLSHKIYPGRHTFQSWAQENASKVLS